MNLAKSDKKYTITEKSGNQINIVCASVERLNVIIADFNLDIDTIADSDTDTPETPEEPCIYETQ